MKELVEGESFQETHDRVKSKVERKAMEALNDLFHRIPFGETIQFSDGSEGKIVKFFDPKVNHDRTDHLQGVPHAGIDVEFEGEHLEFILYQSGWGGSV